jgi:3-(3-hydroxy-phenyl)propionate hydroxylase
MNRPYDCEVLIAGLGPVGAALAALLARRGVTAIAVEKDAGVYPLPRAAHFDHEIMRLFQQLGLAPTMLEASRPATAYEFRNAAGQVLMRYDLDGAAPSGWASGYMFHQPSLEHGLRALLAASPLVETHLETTLAAFEQDADGVTAVLEGPKGSRTVRARWLVACDGARSPVRGALGIDLEDLQFDEPWLVLDVLVRDPGRLPAVNLQICDPARPTTCVLMSQGRHRWEFMLLPGETPEQLMDDAVIHRLLAPWDCAGAIEVERKAVYRFHGRVARQWRQGRVLLAGDAAHQTPPFAGQGMCAGLRDAANLAWKLAALLKGAASPALLDSYQSEREPHVRGVIGLAIQMGRVVCATDPDVVALRDAAMLAQRAAGHAPPPLPPSALGPGCLLSASAGAGELFPQPWAGEARLDDLLGEGPWLLRREALTGPLTPFAEPLAAWLDARGASAVLVRPDRYVFGTGEAEALRQAWRDRMAA